MAEATASAEPPAQRRKFEGAPDGPAADEAAKAQALSEAEARISASLAFSHNAIIDDEPDADANDVLDIKKLDKDMHELVKRAILKGGFTDKTRLQLHAAVRTDFTQIMEHGRDAAVKNSAVLQLGYAGAQLVQIRSTNSKHTGEQLP